LSVVCGAVRHTPNRQDTIENPAVLFEVLSPSTERNDRGFRLDQYRRIVSLHADVIIAQDEPHVYLHLRQPEGAWLLRDCTDPDGSFEIPPLGISIAMRDLYDQIVFPEPAESGRDLLPPANMPE
jgi:Uma2 family endonuclease